MGTGTSIVVIAAGAILRYAVSATTKGVNLHTVGMILMVVGAIGLVLSLIFWNSWGGVRRRAVIDTPAATRHVRDDIV